MKDVTRIHIAKITYDIEIPAKKKLEKYISSLNAYADDPDVLEDIEIRITELLLERRVKPDGVISESDVLAIQKQLGKPEDFMDDDVVAIDPDITKQASRRKLFRNTDNAILGGVLSGIATFAGINPLWTRIIFIVIAFASFGIALLAYIIFWLILPPARTVAEKLQLRGITVTASSIREFSESQAGLDIEGRYRRRVQATGVIVGSIGVLGALLVITGLTGVLLVWFNRVLSSQYASEFHLLPLSLIIVDFAFPIVFFGLIAFAGFGRKVTKQVVIGASILVILSGVSLVSTIGYGTYNSWQQHEALLATVKHTNISLATQFQSAKNLTINSPDVSVDYVIDSIPRLDYEALPGSQPSVTTDGNTVTITIPQQTGSDVYSTPRILTIYGPALTSLTANASNLTYNANGQDLTLNVSENTSANVSGSIGTLSVDLENGSSLAADGATVNQVVARVTASTSAQFGNVRDFTITLPETCPASNQTIVSVQSIVSGHMTVNGERLPDATHSTVCGDILVGDVDQY